MAMGLTIWSLPWILVFPLLPVGPAILQEESEKESAMVEIQSLIAQEQWKKAIKSIKSYKKKHARTDEEKSEVSDLLTETEGAYELEKIDAEYRKKQRVRRPVRKLTKFLQEYAEFPDLTEKAGELLEVLRSQYILLLESFEEWKETEEDGSPRRRFSLITDPKLVKHGEKACRWKTGAGWASFRIPCPQTDWSDYAFFCAWVYNEKVDGRPGYIRIEPRTGGGNYLTTLIAVDWTGWKEVRILLKGKKSLFSRHGNADWKSIEYISLYHDDETGTRVDVILDDIRLEKAVK